MSPELIESIINTVTTVVAILVGLAPLLSAFIKWLQPRTQGKRIDVLESYALRVVEAVEQNGNLLPSDKKKLAMTKLAEYVNDSPLGFKVTDEQLSDLIESAVNKLSDATTPGVKKETKAEVPVNTPTSDFTLTEDQKKALDHFVEIEIDE